MPTTTDLHAEVHAALDADDLTAAAVAIGRLAGTDPAAAALILTGLTGDAA